MPDILDEISDKIFLDKLLKEFKDSIRGYNVKLKEYRKQEKYVEMGKIAHDIKGIAGVFGFDRATEMASQFLDQRDAGNKDEMIKICLELEQYLEREVLEMKPEEK